jgi:hypothetical protein
MRSYGYGCRDEGVQAVGGIGRQGDRLHIGREQCEDHKHPARDREPAGAQEHAIDPC